MSSGINRDPIQGFFDAASGTFMCGDTEQQIQNCERGFIAWIKHLFHKNVYINTSDGKIYVPVNIACAVVGGDIQKNESIGQAFARALHTHATIAQERELVQYRAGLSADPRLPIPPGRTDNAAFIQAQQQAQAIPHGFDGGSSNGPVSQTDATAAQVQQDRVQQPRLSASAELLVRLCNIPELQATEAVTLLTGISCVPLENSAGSLVLKFQKNSRELTFDPIKSAIQLYRGHKLEDLSGIIEDVIVLSTNTELLSFIKFIKIISPNDGEELKKCYNRLVSLKKYLFDEYGLNYDMQDACALASAAVVYPGALGEGGNETFNRAIVLHNISTIFEKFGSSGIRIAENFYPANIPGLAKGYETHLGHRPYRYRVQCFYRDGQNDPYRPGISLLMAMRSVDHWCVNDEQPLYWPTFFPLGLHLVRTDDDDRDEKEWEKSFVIDEIKKRIFQV